MATDPASGSALVWAKPPPIADDTVPTIEIDEIRPARLTLMAPYWMPPAPITQALGFCFTSDLRVVLVSGDDEYWTLPGGTVEPGETLAQTLIREVAEEACARVISYNYLAAQHVADPLHPAGLHSYYQTRWWARVELDPWQSRHEMTARRLVQVENVLSTLSWQDKQIAARLLELAMLDEFEYQVNPDAEPDDGRA